MATGPLPNPDAVRRNKPTIPNRHLPAAGNPNPAPECPYSLESAGQRWWDWVWSTPESTGWSAGNLYAVSRRAHLEDKLVAYNDPDYVPRGTVDPSLAVLKEMTTLDAVLGLTPKARADLRWTIVDTTPDTSQPAATGTNELEAQRAKRRVAAVDPELIAKGSVTNG